MAWGETPLPFFSTLLASLPQVGYDALAGLGQMAPLGLPDLPFAMGGLPPLSYGGGFLGDDDVLSAALARRQADRTATVDGGGDLLAQALARRQARRQMEAGRQAQYAVPTSTDGDIWAAIDELAGDPRLAQAMKLAVLLESGGDPNAVGDEGQSHGFYQIYQGAHAGRISPEQSRDPYAATRYMLPDFQRAYQTVDASLWDTDAKQAAALTAYRAERPAKMYDQARVDQRWGELLARPNTPAGRVATAVTVTATQGAGDWTPDQFRSGLSAGDAISACGPAAAVAFARATGRTPTMQEAVQLARQVGWTPQQGMAGPQSQVALLQQMGIAAELRGGADWQQIAQTVAAGKPVILDTPQHYFVAERYDPQSGRFDFGNSALVLRATGGRRWLTPAELAAIGYQPRSSIFLRN